MPRQKTREELLDRMDELEAEKETLQDQVDSIADMIEGEDVSGESIPRPIFTLCKSKARLPNAPSGREGIRHTLHAYRLNQRTGSRRASFPDSLHTTKSSDNHAAIGVWLR